MPKPTLEQQRAKFALEKVREKEASRQRKDYLIQLRRLPAQLHWAGLGQTVASFRADAKNEVRQEIYKWIEGWLQRREIYPRKPLLDCITGFRDAVAAERPRRRCIRQLPRPPERAAPRRAARHRHVIRAAARRPRAMEPDRGRVQPRPFLRLSLHSGLQREGVAARGGRPRRARRPPRGEPRRRVLEGEWP